MIFYGTLIDHTSSVPNRYGAYNIVIIYNVYTARTSAAPAAVDQ